MYTIYTEKTFYKQANNKKKNIQISHFTNKHTTTRKKNSENILKQQIHVSSGRIERRREHGL
jgi:hypothetical protein